MKRQTLERRILAFLEAAHGHRSEDRLNAIIWRTPRGKDVRLALWFGSIEDDDYIEIGLRSLIEKRYPKRKKKKVIRKPKAA